MSKDNEIALFGITSYDFIAGGTGSGDVNRPYVVDLMSGLSNAGFRLEPELDAFYQDYMKAEALRCKTMNEGKKWFVDREGQSRWFLKTSLSSLPPMQMMP